MKGGWPGISHLLPDFVRLYETNAGCGTSERPPKRSLMAQGGTSRHPGHSYPNGGHSCTMIRENSPSIHTPEIRSGSQSVVQLEGIVSPVCPVFPSVQEALVRGWTAVDGRRSNSLDKPVPSGIQGHSDSCAYITSECDGFKCCRS